MVSDRINIKDCGDSNDAPATPTNLINDSLLSVKIDDVRPTTDRPATAAASSMLNGFSVGEAGSSPRATTDGDDTRPATSPERAPLGQERGRPGDSVQPPPAPSDGSDPRVGKLGDCFKKFLGELMNSPLGPLLKEIGRQLTTGQFDFGRIKDMVKDIRLDDEQMNKLHKGLNEFTDLLKNKLGVDVKVNFRGRGNGQVGIDNVQIAQAGGAHDSNASLTIGQEGQPQGRETLAAGFAGPIENTLTPEQAATRIRNTALESAARV